VGKDDNEMVDAGGATMAGHTETSGGHVGAIGRESQRETGVVWERADAERAHRGSV